MAYRCECLLRWKLKIQPDGYQGWSTWFCRIELEKPYRWMCKWALKVNDTLHISRKKEFSICASDWLKFPCSPKLVKEWTWSSSDRIRWELCEELFIDVFCKNLCVGWWHEWDKEIYEALREQWWSIHRNDTNTLRKRSSNQPRWDCTVSDCSIRTVLQRFWHERRSLCYGYRQRYEKTRKISQYGSLRTVFSDLGLYEYFIMNHSIWFSFILISRFDWMQKDPLSIDIRSQSQHIRLDRRTSR